MASKRKLLEDAVVGAIKARLTYLKAVEPYNGELGAGTPDEAYQLLSGRAPSILLYAGDGKTSTSNLPRTRAIKDVDVDLFLVSTSMRSREDRTRSDIGIYQMIEDLEKLLEGRDSGVAGVGPLELSEEHVIMHRADMCVWRVRYVVPMNVIATNPEDALASLTAIAGSIFQPPDARKIVGVNEVLAP